MKLNDFIRLFAGEEGTAENTRWIRVTSNEPSVHLQLYWGPINKYDYSKFSDEWQVSKVTPDTECAEHYKRQDTQSASELPYVIYAHRADQKGSLKLYLLTQTDNNGYDTYDSCVVCAGDARDAIMIHPNEEFGWNEHFGPSWANSSETVKCEHIGVAAEGVKEGVVCSSFNAG
jgi:hypothetical protein